MAAATPGPLPRTLSAESAPEAAEAAARRAQDELAQALLDGISLRERHRLGTKERRRVSELVSQVVRNEVEKVNASDNVRGLFRLKSGRRHGTTRWVGLNLRMDYLDTVNALAHAMSVCTSLPELDLSALDTYPYAEFEVSEEFVVMLLKEGVAKSSSLQTF